MEFVKKYMVLPTAIMGGARWSSLDGEECEMKRPMIGEISIFLDERKFAAPRAAPKCFFTLMPTKMMP